MKYYQHRITGELLASLENLRDLQMNGQQYCITDIVRPEHKLGNGIICECMRYVDIAKNYKRISKKEALDICPDFGQWRHIDDIHNMSITYLGEIYNRLLAPLRNHGFGNAYTDAGKAKREAYQKALN